MKLKVIPGDYALCKLKNAEDAVFRGPFVSLTRTEDEISLVCRKEDAPQDCAAREDGWDLLKIDAVLDFSLVGVLARISGILAAEGISIFAVSTYDTDYLLVKRENLGRAAEALRRAGFGFSG